MRVRVLCLRCFRLAYMNDVESFSHIYPQFEH